MYSRDWILNTKTLYSKEETRPLTYLFGVVPGRAQFSKVSTYPQLYSRQFTYPVRYQRRDELKGIRYSKYDSEIDRSILSFEDQFKQEQMVLTEPTVNYDYSHAGQVGIQVPETIIGISKVFRIDNFTGSGMWNFEYQYIMNNFDMFYGSGGSGGGAMTHYMIHKMNMELINDMLNVQPAIRFNKTRNRLYLDTSWARISGQAKTKDYYLMIECYEVNDPEVFGDVYKDKWLKRYATTLAKMQWGSNLKKYQNTELPGGIQLSGQELYDEGKEESKELEEELKNSQLEMDFIVG